MPNNPSEQQRLIFDPIPRTDGIEASADPLFEPRANIYLMTGRTAESKPVGIRAQKPCSNDRPRILFGSRKSLCVIDFFRRVALSRISTGISESRGPGDCARCGFQVIEECVDLGEQ